MTTSPPLSDAKAQHYIPKFYLKGFTDKKGVLWVYEKFKPMRESKPKNEAHHPDYYTHAEKGERDETAENVLMEVESKVAPIVRELSTPQYVLTPENAGHLMIFVAIMFARVPSWREYLDNMAARTAKELHRKIASDKERFYKSCADMERSTGKLLGIDYEEMRQSILRENFDVLQESTAYNLGAMFTSALDVAEELKEFGYQTLYAPAGKPFLTSDSPVFTLRPEGDRQASISMGFGWPHVEVYFPLNKRACLKMKRGIQPGAWLADEWRVEQINNIVMATATRYMYSSQGYPRIGRLFDERGCKVRPGKEAFLSKPPTGHGVLF
jgi:hypothetical protein